MRRSEFGQVAKFEQGETDLSLRKWLQAARASTLRAKISPAWERHFT